MSSVYSALGPKLLSRTGEQFYCVDEWSPNGQPLLLTMADPGEWPSSYHRFPYLSLE